MSRDAESYQRTSKPFVFGFLPLSPAPGTVLLVEPTGYTRARRRHHGHQVSARCTTKDEFQNTTPLGGQCRAGYEGAKRGDRRGCRPPVQHPTRSATAGAVGATGGCVDGRTTGHGQDADGKPWPGEANVPFRVHRIELRRVVGGCGRRPSVTCSRRPQGAPPRSSSSTRSTQSGSVTVERSCRTAARRRSIGCSTRAASTRQPVSSCLPRRTDPRRSMPALLRPARFDRRVEIPSPNVPRPAAILSRPHGRQAFRRRCRPRCGRAGHTGLLGGGSGQPHQRGCHRRGAC